MSQPLRIREAALHRLAIPMRVAFEHAAATRRVADPIVLRLLAEAPHADLAGCGETLARPYLTGETVESVCEDVERLFLPLLLQFRPASFPAALEFIDALPFECEGRCVNAARAVVELALLDLAGRAFRRRAADASGWMGLAGFGAPGCLGKARYSGVVIGRGALKCAALVRVQRAWGLRDFKLKVAVPGWEQRLAVAGRALRSAIARGHCTLRVDANGGWSAEDVTAAIPLLESAGVCALEQPLSPADDDRLTQLATRTRCDLVADESLVTAADARRLIESGGVQVFNLRIAKVGGLLPALRLAQLAIGAGRDVQLGCLVGETSVLTAAGLAFLEACPRVRFLEGAFGRFMLRHDVVRRPISIAFGARPRALSGFGLGLEPDPALLQRAGDGAAVFRF
ncbi:MAG TPA: enolase C-terminal domain-like protein [Phycisphaerae bacterium]|nr:enolase C-terminal domain-like protein [Phycisphaerae bacterium]